jgi:hypothetical protein
MAEPREITMRTARLWLDDDDIMRCDCFPGIEQTLADAEQVMAAFWGLAGQRRVPALVDIRNVKSIERAARAHYSGPESARVHLAVALLVGSPLSRAIGNFFMGLNKPLIPSRLFTSEPDALAWLRGFVASSQARHAGSRGAAAGQPGCVS